MSSKGMTAVREASRLVLDVSELLRNPGSSKRFQMQEEIAGLETGLAHIRGPAALEFGAESLVEGVLVTGTVRGRAAFECRRCLTRTEQEFSTSVEELFVLGADEDDEAYPVRGEHIDLEPMVRDAVVLEMPLNPLCRPDCKGLCPQCGQDLNASDCGHRPDTTDARWEPLRRLLETMGD